MVYWSRVYFCLQLAILDYLRIDFIEYEQVTE